MGTLEEFPKSAWQAVCKVIGLKSGKIGPAEYSFYARSCISRSV